MAFMMPVMKKNYNIYKSNGNRSMSERSNDKASTKSTSSCCSTRRLHSSSRSKDGPSLSTSPSSDFLVGSSPAHRSFGTMSRPSAFHHSSQMHHHGVTSRNSSRNSHSSLQSPAKPSSSSSSSPKVSSKSSLNMFHSKLVDKFRRSRTSKSKDNSSSMTSSKDIARKKS